MSTEVDFPAGPVADRLTLWPVDDGKYGLDAVFQGASGFERCEEHRVALEAIGARCSLIQGLDNSWSLRLGPLTAHEVGKAISAFVVDGGLRHSRQIQPTHDNGGYVNLSVDGRGSAWPACFAASPGVLGAVSGPGGRDDAPERRVAAASARTASNDGSGCCVSS